MTDQPLLLIADLAGSLSEKCDGSEPVYGEIWLRRYEEQLLVYWEVRQVPLDEDCETLRDSRHTDVLYGLARSQGATRWQTLFALPAGKLPAEIGPLPAAFADPGSRDKVLQAALAAVNSEIYMPLGRARFTLKGHCWRAGYGARLV
jgi:hypothetical protein